MYHPRMSVNTQYHGTGHTLKIEGIQQDTMYHSGDVLEYTVSETEQTLRIEGIEQNPMDHPEISLYTPA